MPRPVHPVVSDLSQVTGVELLGSRWPTTGPGWPTCWSVGRERELGEVPRYGSVA